MTETNAVRIERTPTYNDLEITRLVHRALAEVREGGRFGDRKVFIAALWTQMLAIEAQTGGTLTEGATLEHFKAWLLRSRLLTVDGSADGARLIVLCRADLVAAMDPAQVAMSETVMDGASFHLALDPGVARVEYAARVAHQGSATATVLPFDRSVRVNSTARTKVHESQVQPTHRVYARAREGRSC